MILLSLGSNLGARESYLHQAVVALNRIGKVIETSPILRSEPWGYESDNYYLNQLVEITTDLSPYELLKATQQIERDLGRTSKSVDGVYSDRTIDIDILLFDDEIINSEELIVPHPGIEDRDFIKKLLSRNASAALCSLSLRGHVL